MAYPTALSFDPGAVETPCIVCDLGVLGANLELLSDVQRRSGGKILLALKGFAMWSVFPLVRQHLAGTAASSPHEARLGREELGGEVHVYAPAYAEPDLNEILELADHVVFNSLAQWRRLGAVVRRHTREIRCGLRINPEHSEVAVEMYDPCRPGSRLGVTRADLDPAALEGITGLHFHTLCQSDSDALERTLRVVEDRFAHELALMQWVNFGGGHHLTRPGYDIERLVRLIREFRQRHQVEVYLEPGEAVARDAGVLVASVLDISGSDVRTAILDTSAAAHMPDVLEMPYRPEVVGAGPPEEHPHRYRLGGLTCLAGDVIGDYSFPEALRVGDRVVFTDMAVYTMVKSTTFNGLRLPSIYTCGPGAEGLQLVRRFGYADYRARLS